jgi:hypothetical protein
MNSCAIEFQDGFRAVTSRNALRKAKPSPNGKRAAVVSRQSVGNPPAGAASRPARSI